MTEPMQEPSFKALRFNVSKELNSRTLMGEVRGIEIKERLITLMADLQRNEVIVVDATDSLIFDYEFSGHAFAPFFQRGAAATVQSLIFRIARSDRPAFFHGILKRLNAVGAKYAESQQTFANAGLFCKVAEEAQGPIEYIGELSPNDKDILAAIDTSGSASVENLHASTRLSHEELVDCVRRLVRYGFLWEFAAEHRYYSFCNFLSEKA